jgi:acyl carrier protein
MSIEERVISVIRENLENGKGIAITLESELAKDLDIDSLNALTILFGLEKEFSISLDESAFAACKTVADVIVGLKNKYPQLQGS